MDYLDKDTGGLLDPETVFGWATMVMNQRPQDLGSSESPACGLVDNASSLFSQNPTHRPLAMLRKVQGQQGTR